jgi:hypothetical protein
MSGATTFQKNNQKLNNKEDEKENFMKLKLSILTLLLSACASIHNGNYAEVVGETKAKGTDARPSKNGILVSGKEIDSLSSKYVTAIDFTFENSTSDWMEVKKVDVSFGNPTLDKTINFPVGNSLVAWADSAKQLEAISAHNTAMILGAITAMGTVATSSRNSNTSQLGSAVALGGAMAITADSVSKTKNNLELSKIVPTSHLFSEGFVIPPGMHTKKWVTLYTAKPLDIAYVEAIYLTMHLGNGATEKIKLNFRNNPWSDYQLSKWQNGHEEVKKRMKQNLTNSI